MASVLPSDIRIYSAFAEPSYDGSSTLGAAITTTTATSLTITSATSFPPSGEFLILIDTEFIYVTQGAGTTTWTLIRGALGSTAATHLINATVTTFAGGPVNMNGKLAFSDITSGDTADYVSSSTSDTKLQITLTGRDSTGVIQSETKTINGNTVVNGSQVWDRFEKVGLASGTTLTSNPLTSAATSMTVTAATNFPSSGNYYVRMGLEIVQVTGGQGTTTWTIGRAQLGTLATAHNSGDGIYLLPFGDVAVYDHTALVSGMAQAGANPTGVTPALITLQSGQGSTAGLSVGQIIYTTGGTGPNQIRTIIATSGYGTDVVAVSRSWGTVPDATTTYRINNGFQLDFAPNQIINVHRFLWNAQAQAAGGSNIIFYQKGYVVNDNTTTTLTPPSGFSGVQHEITTVTGALPSGATLQYAIATSANDTQYWATRQTAPSGGYGAYTAVGTPFTQTANSGNMASGAAPNSAGAIGVVFELALNAGTAPYKGNATYQVQGATT